MNFGCKILDMHLSSAAVFVAAALSVMQTSSRQIVNVGPAPIGPYSVAVKADGFIYVSGMLSQDDAGTIVGADVAAQTKRILERMRAVPEASGSSLAQAVAVTVYLKSASDFAAMNEAYRVHWPKDPPTRTTVIADLLLGALVEISMVAVPNGAPRSVIHPDGWARVAESVQLRDQNRRDAVSFRPGAAKRHRQHPGAGRYRHSNEGSDGECRGAPACGADGSLSHRQRTRLPPGCRCVSADERRLRVIFQEGSAGARDGEGGPCGQRLCG